jgi:Sigma-70, region 4
MEALLEFCARVLGRGDGAMQAADEARGRAPSGDRVALLAAALAACRAREPAQVPAPAQAAEPHGLAEAVAGEPHGPAEAVAGEPHGPAEAVAGEPHGPAETVAGEPHGLAEAVAGEPHGLAEAVAGEPHGLAEAVAGEPRGLAEAVAGELAVANARLPQRQREALAVRELLGLPHDQIARVIGIDSHAVAPLLARARLRFRAQLRGDLAAAPSCDERERSLRAIARRQDSEPLQEVDTAWLMEHLRQCPACNQAHAAMLEASVCYRAWRVQADDRPGVDHGAPAPGSAAGQ